MFIAQVTDNTMLETFQLSIAVDNGATSGRVEYEGASDAIAQFQEDLRLVRDRWGHFINPQFADPKSITTAFNDLEFYEGEVTEGIDLLNDEYPALPEGTVS